MQRATSGTFKTKFVNDVILNAVNAMRMSARSVNLGSSLKVAFAIPAMDPVRHAMQLVLTVALLVNSQVP